MHNMSATELKNCEACVEIFTGHSGTNLQAFVAAHNAHFYGAN